MNTTDNNARDVTYNKYNRFYDNVPEDSPALSCLRKYQRTVHELTSI